MERHALRMHLFVLVFGMVVGGVATAQDEPYTGPNGLPAPTGTNPETGEEWKPGDAYYLVFTTSQTYTGTEVNDTASGGAITYFDNLVNAVADGSSIAGVAEATWFCLGSTATVDARDQLKGGDHPVYRLDPLVKIADDFADLWNGNIDADINYTEDGVLIYGTGGLGSEYVWTGSTTAGVGDPGKELGSAWSAGGDIMHGQCNVNGGFWFYRNQYHAANQRLYAVSEKLEIQPPPPTATLLMLR